MKPNLIEVFKTAMAKIFIDDRLRHTHVTVYIALIYAWNKAYFKNPISINREEIMKLSKLKATKTYNKVLWDLHAFGYIEYLPSKNPYVGSLVNIRFPSQSNTGVGSKTRVKNPIVGSQAEPPSYTKDKTDNTNTSKTPSLEIIREFFKEKKWSDNEAVKFYNHYQSQGWKKRGNIKITDWRAAAHSWMIKSHDFDRSDSEDKKWLNNKNINYNEPL